MDNQYKQKFYNYPSINPYTDIKIKSNKEYKKLTREFGDPYYKTLNLTHQEISQDILYNILLYSDAYDIHKLCTINTMASQLCHQNIWKIKFKQDNLPDMTPNQLYTLEEYVKIFNYKLLASDIIQHIKNRNYLRRHVKNRIYKSIYNLTFYNVNTLDDIVYPIIFPKHVDILPGSDVNVSISFDYDTDPPEPVLTINNISAFMDWELFHIFIVKLLYDGVNPDYFMETRQEKVTHTLRKILYPIRI